MDPVLSSLAIDLLAVNTKLRRHQETYSKGMYDPSTGRWEANRPWNADPVESTIKACVHRSVPKQLLDEIPEGTRQQVRAMVWSRTDLRSDDEATGTLADEIFFRGDWHKVLHVWDRREGGYTKAALGAVRMTGREV